MIYKDNSVNRTFSGSDIRTQVLEIGTLVSVTLEFNPDAQIVTLSLLIPSIKLNGNPTNFKTYALWTTKRSGFTAVQPGPLETYHTISLEGTASLVEF